MTFKHLASYGARTVTTVALGQRAVTTVALVDREIDFSTRNGKARVFINKTLSTETSYQQDVINRDHLST
jgi:hypothetical protein